MSRRVTPFLVLEGAYMALELHVMRLRYHYTTVLLALAVASLAFWQVYFAPPPDFPADHIVTIEEGLPVSGIAASLAEQKLIRSPLAFEVIARVTGTGETIQSGKYIFAKPIGLVALYSRLANGEFGITATRVVIIEGMRVREIARLMKAEFPDFDDESFVEEALPLEGYLFPDTYFLYPDITPHELIELMYANFETRKAEVIDDAKASGRPFPDLLVMASLLEKEARSIGEKRMVAGILWNRVELGMPLQVDAVFGYINDVPIYSPLFSDLDVESPYNTYRNKGLPPGPIGNPGIASIRAAATPAETEYLYYLTGRDGNMYYAETFEEHKRNRARYLD